jgi:hypothetical protein
MTPETPSFVPGRRWRVGFSVTLSALAAIALVVMVNHLAITRRVWRHDLTQGQSYRLSPLTTQTLAALTNEVRVTVVFNRESALYPHVDSLLREYQSRSPHLLVQRIDPVRNPALARLKRSEFKLGSKGGNVVVFESGSRLRVVPEEDLSIYNSDDIQALVHGGHNEIRRSAFTGENRFTSSIAALLDGTQAHAVYLVGHGEQAWDGENSGVGFADFDRLLRGEKNLRVDPCNLITNDLPADTQLVIIAGPTSQFLPIELSRVEAYLRRGGRLLVAMNSEAVAVRTGLEEMLMRWAVLCPPMIAGEGNKVYVRNGFDVLSKTFGTHALMAPLRRAETQLYFPFPRVIGPVDPRALPPDAARAEVLVTTTDQGLTRSDFRGGNAAFSAENGDQKDRLVPLAVASEKGGVSGVAAGRGATRLVVVGDSALLSNGFIDNVGNRDFAGLCVSWLLDRPQSLAIGPRPLREWRLSLSGSQLNLLQWSLLGGLPGSVLTLGLVIWSRRRA